jgi:hypothetical protein
MLPGQLVEFSQRPIKDTSPDAAFHRAVFVDPQLPPVSHLVYPWCGHDFINALT